VAGVVNYHCKDLGLKITIAKLFELKTAMSATISIQCTCNYWNLIKGPLTPSISPGLYSRIGRGVLQHGIRARRSQVRALTTHISLRVIIPTYKSPYGGARVEHTSGGGVLASTQ
jgi:hypothetical protein